MTESAKRTFDNLFKEHYQRLYTMVFRFTGNKEDAEDVLQNAFLNAYKGWDDFRGDSSPFTWLYRITVNTARQTMKKERRLHVTNYAEEHQMTENQVYHVINSAGDSEDQYLVERVKQSCLQMFMNCMPPKYRVVFTLRVILEFTVADTADILECSEAVVKTDLHRAREIIKSHFDGRCSLVCKDGVCCCSTFANHLYKNRQTEKLLTIRAIPQQERDSARRYREELNTVLDFEHLYYTDIRGINYPEFKKHIKELREEGRLHILNDKN